MTSPRIRVLQLANGLGRGGTEKTLQLFAANLDPSVFEPFVFAFSDGERGRALRDAGLPVFIGQDLLQVLERIRPDIVHVHRAGWPEPKLMRTLRLAGIPRIVETNVFGRFDPTPDGMAVDKRLFVSRFCLERYARDNGICLPDAKLDFLYNPVDTDFYDSRPINRNWSSPVFGRLSRSDPGKWSPLALEILPLVKSSLPDFKLRIIGAIPEAREFVRSKKLEHNVEFCEPVNGESKLADFLGSVNLLAHANDAGESFGLAIAEAMAAGLPVVTHPARGNRDNAQLELVEHGVNGLVAGNVRDYADAVVRLLSSPDEARAMGHAGREKARKCFRVQQLSAKLEKIYLELINKGNNVADADTYSRTPLQRLHAGGAQL